VRMLWFGDMAATGFGSVTTDIGRELLNLGVDVRFISQNDLGTVPPEPFGSRTLDLATFASEMGRTGMHVKGVNDVVGDIIDGTTPAHLASGEEWGDWKPDVAVLLGDFVAARMLISSFTDAFARIPTFHYVPIEGTDLPPLWGDLWRTVKPIAMSVFGQDQIERVTGQRPPLAYHGVDPNGFHPVSPSEPIIVPRGTEKDAPEVHLTSRDACRRFFGGDPGHTWVLRTDRNMPRKRYGSLLRAMQPVLEAHDEVRLVIHCNIFDQGGYLPDSVSKYPPALRQKVIFTQLGPVPRPVLNALYAASDLYATTSAEGFGLCIAESLMCGVPAVGMDYSAVPEVIGPAGAVVPVHSEYDNEYDHKWAWPDEDAFAEKVDYLVSHPKKRRELGALGPAHVRDNFSWANAARVIADVCSGSALPGSS